MNEFICSNCQEKIDYKDISICPNCGSIVCQNCNKKNGNSCPNCYEQLHRLI